MDGGRQTLTHEERLLLRRLVNDKRRESLAHKPLTASSARRSRSIDSWLPPPTWRDIDLTPREREIVELRAVGLGNGEIAIQLGIGPNSVASYFALARKKLSVAVMRSPTDPSGARELRTEERSAN